MSEVEVSPSHDRPDAADTPVGRRRADPMSWGERAARIVVGAPDRLGLAMFWSALTISALLFLGIFNPYLVIVITLVLIVATWRLAPEPVAADERSVAGTIVAVCLAFAWVWVNFPFREQMLSAVRDPAAYALRGWYLRDHGSPIVDVSHGFDGITGVSGAVVGGAGFAAKHGHIYVQGSSLVSGYFGVAARFGGLRGMLSSNLIIGAIALLLVYAVARRIMGPLWALVPMVGLAVSMPMIYFSRATYTESLSLAVTFAALVVLGSAMRSRRLSLFALGGAMIGVSALARPDGALSVIGALVAVVAAALAATDPQTRRLLRKAVVLTAVGGGITVAAGWWDLRHNSPSYYATQVTNLFLLYKAMVALVVIGLALTFVPLDRLRRLVATRRVATSRVAIGFVLVVCAIMASRPLWWKGHFNHTAAIVASIAQRQQDQGLPVDPTRSYDEHTVTWFAWYFTWPVVILSAVGLALLLSRIVRRRDGVVLMTFAVFGVVATLYLNRVAITPDQIWATRRLLPVVFPVLVTAAAYAAYRIWQLARPGLRTVAIPLALVVAVGPAVQFRQLFQQPEFAGGVAAMQSMCAAVDRGEAGSQRLVVMTGGPPPTGYWLPTVRFLCDATVVDLQTATPAKLARIRQNWGNKPVTVVTFDLGSVTWTTGGPPPATYSGSVTTWDEPLTHRPEKVVVTGCTFWVGTLGANGVLTPLPAS